MAGHQRLIDDFKRLAQKNALAHGYLFYGAPNIGKKTFALRLAGFLETGEFQESVLPQDAMVIAPDEEETIGIDASRSVRHFLSEKPVISPRRTVVVDSAEQMTREAENALLKIAEEPPPSSLLILVSRDPESLSQTLRSRLQCIYFSGMPKEPVADTALLHSAERLLASGFWERRNMIKGLVEKDDFDFGKFLDAMIAALSKGIRAGKPAKNFAQWHHLLELRRQVQSFNLNPKLQIEAFMNKTNE